MGSHPVGMWVLLRAAAAAAVHWAVRSSRCSCCLWNEDDRFPASLRWLRQKDEWKVCIIILYCHKGQVFLTQVSDSRPTATVSQLFFCLFISHVKPMCQYSNSFFFFFLAGGCKQRDKHVFAYFLLEILKMATMWEDNKAGIDVCGQHLCFCFSVLKHTDFPSL